MNKITKKVLAIVSTVVFITLNILHVIFPVWLIAEDIQSGTMIGTGIEMGALFPWMIEALSVPYVLAQIVYYIVFRKVKYSHILCNVAFWSYIFQVALFNILLCF